MAAATPKAFWERAADASCPGSGAGIASSSGIRRRSAGSSARRPTSPTTRSITTSLHGRGGHAALIYFNERGERAVFTYAQLLYEVKRHRGGAPRPWAFSKGDRLTIYMPHVARSDHA